MLYVLCLPRFAAADADRIDAFRRRHEPARATLVPPHLTLVFGAAIACRPALEATLAALAATAPAFDLTLGDPHAHLDDTRREYAFYLRALDGAGPLTRLHAALHDGPGLPTRRPDTPFDPHLTLTGAPEAGPVTAAAAAFAAAAWPLPVRGHVDAVEIMQLAEGCLDRVAHVPLLGTESTGKAPASAQGVRP
ncbi:2'-5' RNA ligase family protein [Tistrella mobilis]|uniref:2'-5' RNA ligase family protein n=1 Tax=Tistrella mobilis TaxID=171437 RepID=UPI00355636D1